MEVHGVQAKMTTLTSAQYRETVKQPKKSKYGNKRVEYDGHTFDSILERDYYIHLKLRERLGEVYEVEMQRPISLRVNGFVVGTLRVDFWFYDDVQKRTRVVDTKGFETDVSRIKRKLVKAIHGIDVEIVKKGDF